MGGRATLCVLYPLFPSVPIPAALKLTRKGSGTQNVEFCIETPPALSVPDQFTLSKHMRPVFCCPLSLAAISWCLPVEFQALPWSLILGTTGLIVQDIGLLCEVLRIVECEMPWARSLWACAVYSFSLSPREGPRHLRGWLVLQQWR